ncbi:MAG: FAD:protein FMN transferase [Gammaproteobacteria bacterium]
MGTRYIVKIFGLPTGVNPDRIQSTIDEALTAIDRLMSTYRVDSVLSRFNASRSIDWVEVAPELVRVVEEAQRVSRVSGGAFDISVGPLVALWGFGPSSSAYRIPSSEAIQAVKARVGYHRIHTRVSPPALRKDLPGVELDLSAIAPGYAVDRVAELLDAHRAQGYLVDIGGEQRIKGRKSDGMPWRIGIASPVEVNPGIRQTLLLTAGGLATSGDYRNNFEQGGKRYSHLIDPVSGYPIAHTLASVTVISDTAMRADALATALMVLGPVRGLALAERERLAALFIVREGNGFRDIGTSGFKRVVELERMPERSPSSDRGARL